MWDACSEMGRFPYNQWERGQSGAGAGGGRRGLAGRQGSAWEADTGGGKEWRAGLAAAQGQSLCTDDVSSR